MMQQQDSNDGGQAVGGQAVGGVDDRAVSQPASDFSPAYVIAQDIEDLSPTTQGCLGLLIQNIKNKTAQLDIDDAGHITIDNKKQKKIWADASQANIIAVPKSEANMQLKIDACLELIKYLKEEITPSGVLMDSSKIHLSGGNQYRQGFEFIKTKQVLGSGSCAGDIVVVKDRKYDTEHALKTMMISCFREDEIRCWVDLSDSGYVPQLHLFKIENNKVEMHMEKLKGVKTLRSIIDEQVAIMYQTDYSLIKPFSLYVLNGALEAVSDMHSKLWLHKDLHAENVMLQKESETSLQVKIIDFGLAGPLMTVRAGLDVRGFQADIAQVVRLFSALYCGQEFDSVWDIQNNWKSKLTNMFAEPSLLSDEDKKELFCLLDGALKILLPADVPAYMGTVKGHLDKAMGDQANQDDIMRKVVSLIFFPPKPTDVPDSIKASEMRAPTEGTDVADSSIARHRMPQPGDRPDRYTGMHPIHDRPASPVTDELLQQLRLSVSIQPDHS